MKEEESAITLRDGGKTDKISNKTKIGAYIAIGLLLILALWANTTNKDLSVDVEKVASITSWSVGATTTDSFGFFRSKKYPDLGVEIMSVGASDKGGVYRANDTLTTKSVGAVRIKVTNIGEIASADWKFKISIPTKEPFTYNSPFLAPLIKDQEKIFIFTFDKLAATSSAQIKIEIEPSVPEKYTENNTTAREVEIY